VNVAHGTGTAQGDCDCRKQEHCGENLTDHLTSSVRLAEVVILLIHEMSTAIAETRSITDQRRSRTGRSCFAATVVELVGDDEAASL
jgi:hypothetical protein